MQRVSPVGQETFSVTMPAELTVKELPATLAIGTAAGGWTTCSGRTPPPGGGDSLGGGGLLLGGGVVLAAASTVSLKLCVAGAPTPLLAVNVIVNSRSGWGCLRAPRSQR